MNRNNERHFNNVPQTHVSRTRFKRDQNILTTFNAGELIPFYVDEVLPGDTFNVSTAAIIRMTTPKYPVFDDAYIDFYYFFCPNRILWDNFKRFMGEANDTPWMPTKTYQVPKIVIVSNEEAKTLVDLQGPKEGSILDYMGVPTKINEKEGVGETQINALPIRAYVKIWNEFFRDQNVENPAALSTDDENRKYNDVEGGDTNTTEYWAENGGRCLPVSRFHDYFSSCLPSPQRGPEVTIALTGNAPVKMYDHQGINGPTNPTILWMSGAAAYLAQNNANETVVALGGTEQTGGESVARYLATDLSNVEAATINQLRQAFAVQHY